MTCVFLYQGLPKNTKLFAITSWIKIVQVILDSGQVMPILGDGAKLEV
jgi:hypothetical protein